MTLLKTINTAPFGVPGLGFKRNLAEDLVIAPYASLLALPYQPKAVVENVAAFAELGALGIYGLYEAIDYTPARLPAGRKHALVSGIHGASPGHDPGGTGQQAGAGSRRH